MIHMLCAVVCVLCVHTGDTQVSIMGGGNQKLKCQMVVIFTTKYEKIKKSVDT